jgi:hypothetical protein
MTRITMAMKSLFRKKSKSTSSPNTTSTNEDATASSEHFAHEPSSPGLEPVFDEPVSYEDPPNTQNEHIRAGALANIPEIIMNDDSFLSTTTEQFPRYSYSFDISRADIDIAQLDSRNSYPTIVVTPASVDGHSGEL